jgi:hypothetical protein
MRVSFTRFWKLKGFWFEVTAAEKKLAADVIFNSQNRTAPNISRCAARQRKQPK